MTTYIKGATLDFPHLWKHFAMSKDNGGRWETTSGTQQWVVDYLSQYRTPSRSWPLSYAKAMLTQKFAKLIVDKEPELAKKIGIAE